MRNIFSTVLLLILGFPTVALSEVEVTGRLDLEASFFADDGQFTGQDYQRNLSLAAEPNIYWQAGNNSLSFTPFYRLDENDDERSHGDIRELLFSHYRGDWEFKAGVGKVFWGVTEFNHLVDVINQTDSVDAFDGEQKLGQPMLAVSKVTDSGIFDVFILPGFRERTFVGEEGRLRSGLVVDTDNAQYESSEEDDHIDVALRWAHSIDVYDFGLHVFNGTDREPLLQAATVNGETVLQPFYQQATQFGIDAQATVDSWLLKFEGLAKFTDADDYLAAQAGVEYTFYGIAETVADIGVLFEYGWDERGEEATSIAQNDTFIGARLALNNTNDTAILLGGSMDNDFQTRTYIVEASQRLNDFWSIVVDASIFEASDTNDPAAALEDDDRLQITLERYF